MALKNVSHKRIKIISEPIMEANIQQKKLLDFKIVIFFCNNIPEYGIENYSTVSLGSPSI